ncbi:MAG: stage V sporulation protein AC [Christensenellales bacterium]
MLDPKTYNEFVIQTAPKTKMARTLLAAFIVGGLICCIGQAVSDIAKLIKPSLDKEALAAWTSVTMIFLGSFFTGLGLYDRLGRIAGAGSIIPITGFANSIVSPAMEFNREGIVFGICAKMFTVAGPIIVFGVALSVIAGIIGLFL